MGTAADDLYELERDHIEDPPEKQDLFDKIADANLVEDINTHGMKLDFGKHRGQLYTRVPVGYLLWMVNVDHTRQDIAKAELKRRGTIVPTCDISGHAIDKASLRCLEIWKKDHKRNEGFHAWLVRIVSEALQTFDSDSKGAYYHKGMKLIFEEDTAWPVLKTIMKKRFRK